MATTRNELEIFDPNADANYRDGGTISWPVLKSVYDVETYVNRMMQEAPTSLEMFAKSLNKPLVKGTALPPSMESFATFSLMPEVHNGGVLQMPGIPPESIRKIVREHVAPQMIINLRVADIQRYAQPTTHPWKPGWSVELREGLKNPTKEERQDVKDAMTFLLNCNAEYGNDAIKRDARQLTNFSTFLAELVRDSLTYDFAPVWTERDLKNRVKAFKALSGYNIRLATRDGYDGNPDIFAVAVDEAGNIIGKFTREDLVMMVRNPRSDADIYGYGYGEIEQSIRAIQGTTMALDSAVDEYNRNSVPNGLLTAQGLWTQRQIDALSRVWQNLKKGTSKSWALPIIPLPKEGKLELMDLTNLNGNDMRGQNFFNMLAGVLCSIYRFPIARLGYHASGPGPDNKPDATTNAAMTDDYDPGLEPLLQSVESIINEYILSSRWPHLIFSFNGKSAKSDLRAYEFKINSMTLGERRAMADLPSLESSAKSPEEKLLARLMSMAPTDANLAGVFQNLASAMFAKTDNSQEGGAEAEMSSKSDPAASALHGHSSGVRRDSAAEEASAES